MSNEYAYLSLINYLKPKNSLSILVARSGQTASMCV